MPDIPITVRGEVDARAVQQLRRCAEAGDAVAGVLCADGRGRRERRLASGFLALAAGRRFDERGPGGEMDSPPVLLHVDSEPGHDYIAAMTLVAAHGDTIEIRHRLTPIGVAMAPADTFDPYKH